VGDLVLVTGTLGGPGAALAAWERGGEPSAWARSRFAAPSPRLAAGQALAAAGATAMQDISDGLAADARHLGAASGVWLALDERRLPVGPGVEPASALQSGEEYELLVTMPPAAFAALAGRWEAEHGVLLTVIGEVAPAGDGPEVPTARGHDHFGTDR
jgi:thiamine-monophosphate kinase